jgi:hypothetical protein
MPMPIEIRGERTTEYVDRFLKNNGKFNTLFNTITHGILIRLAAITALLRSLSAGHTLLFRTEHASGASSVQCPRYPP